MNHTIRAIVSGGPLYRAIFRLVLIGLSFVAFEHHASAQVVDLEGRSGGNPRVAVDGQGRATIIHIANDGEPSLPIDPNAWRVRGVTNVQGAPELNPVPGTWISESPVTITPPGEIQTILAMGANPRMALAVAPDGTRYAAWVRTVDGVRRIEVSASQGFQSAFGPPSAVLSACGSPSDMNRLHLAADNSGAHLVYMDQCVSGSSTRWRAVAITPSGSVGVPFALTPDTSGSHGPLMRRSGRTFFVSIGRAAGSPLYLYELGGTQVVASRNVILDGSDVGPGWHAVAWGSENIATAARVFSDGEYKVLVDVGTITSATGADQVIFDPRPGVSALISPQLAAGPGGQLVVAWLEGDAVYFSIRRPGSGGWSVPVQIPNHPNFVSALADSLQVGVSATGVAHVVWNGVFSNTTGTTTEVFASSIKLNEGTPSATQSSPITLLSTFGGNMWPDLAVFPDGSAIVVWTQGFGSTVFGSGAAKIPSPPVRVENLARPRVLGKARVGSRLRSTSGTWSPSSATLARQWLANNKAIRGRTQSSLKLTNRERGKRISVRVTASVSGQSPAIAVSNLTSRVVGR